MAAAPPGHRPGRPGRLSRAGLPDVRGRRGARRCACVASDSLTALGPETPALVWVNSPSNPTGRVLPVEHLRKMVDWCRERGVAAGLRRVLPRVRLGGATPVSVLHPDVCGGVHQGILAVHSLSKRSNLAGYRCAFVAGDPPWSASCSPSARTSGLMMPGPQQGAMVAALEDDAHVAEQHARVRRPAGDAARRARAGAGFRIDHSEASLYLWATRDEALLGHGRLARRAGHPGGARGLLRRRRRAARARRAHRHRRAGRGAAAGLTPPGARGRRQGSGEEGEVDVSRRQVIALVRPDRSGGVGRPTTAVARDRSAPRRAGRRRSVRRSSRSTWPRRTA